MKVLECGKGRYAKLWVDDIDKVEQEAVAQIIQLCQMPQLFHHVAIMPDVHLGKGACIGSVIPLEGAVCPNMVGVDIGCGMALYPTGLKYEGELSTKEYWQEKLAQWYDRIAVGHNGRTQLTKYDLEPSYHALMGADKPLPSCTPHIAHAQGYKSTENMIELQLGTLGGGNHFLEAQRDDEGNVFLMVHSGSRNVGLQIADHYMYLAKKLNNKWRSYAPPDLNWLPTDSEEGAAYMNDMQWAVDYALLNRQLMLRMALKILGVRWDESKIINQPHNYVALEHHYKRNVYVHRKGATRARKGELGIIPGSMGTPSYIVQGKGHHESFMSASHGAGRVMGRRRAKDELTVQQFEAKMSATFTKAEVDKLDESPMAYKNINEVMEQQSPLVNIVKELHPIITMKG